jgi:type VI secretion system protein ImpL
LASTRSLLLRVPVSQRIYGRIRTNPQYTQQIDLLNEFGESVRATYVVNPKVQKSLAMPYLFTLQGYESIDFSPESNVISSIVNESWLLESEDKARVDFIKEDLDDISKKVKEHYLSEYRTYWLTVYNNLEVKPFKDLRHANDVLTSFADPVYSPLVAILQVGATNTQLSNQLAANMAEDNADGAKGKLASFAAANVPWTVVDKEFRSINGLLRESAKQPAPINQVLMRVRQLQEFVAEMTMAPDPYKQAFDVAKARYHSGSGNAITSLRAYAKSAPRPLNRWLMSLADESWRVILQAAHGHVNAEWRNRVYRPYMQALAGRYPLNHSAQDELAILDFIEFFKPGGTIDTFHQEYVKPFVNTRRGWSNKGVDDYSLGLSQNTLKQIQLSQAIKNIYFRESPEVPGITFQLRPYHMRKNDARFMIEMGENRISYSHGPKFWKKVKWIGNDDAQRVRILFESLNEQQFSKTYEGPWAWFRLLDNSSLRKTSNSSIYQVTFGIDDGLASTNATSSPMHSITYEIKVKSVNNPFNRNLLGSFRCPERI